MLKSIGLGLIGGLAAAGGYFGRGYFELAPRPDRSAPPVDLERGGAALESERDRFEADLGRAVRRIEGLERELEAARAASERSRAESAHEGDLARAELEGALSDQAARIARLEQELELARAGAARAEELSALLEGLAAEARLGSLYAALDSLWPATPERMHELEDWVGQARAELALLEPLRRERERLAERGEDAVAAWARSGLDTLIGRLEQLGDPEHGPLGGLSLEHGWGVERRLAFASEIARRSVEDPSAVAAWKSAASHLAQDPRFRGFELEARVGLLPLGPDPASGLLEFAVLATGRAPTRDESGRLGLDAGAAAVLVLIPPGRGWQGAQAKDPAGPNHDPLAEADDGGVGPIEHSPYLIGKHELSQAQWHALTGESPSRYGPGHWGGVDVDSSHPVTDVTWEAASSTLTRHGLRLPSEAEWERAARAGASGSWWTGSSVRSLEGAVNLADRWARDNGGAAWGRHLDWLDDGHTVAAPIDAFRPNPFGLHSVHGNVWEWCADSFAPRQFSQDAPTDPIVELPTTTLRVIRGGAFNSNALDARSAHRSSSPQDAAGSSLGLRLAADSPSRPAESRGDRAQ